MKSLFKFVLFTLVLLVILAFVGVEPLASYKDNLIGSSNDVPSTPPSILTAPTPAYVDDTANETSSTLPEEDMQSGLVFTQYNDEASGFSIDYPASWAISNTKPSDSEERFRVSFTGNFNEEPNEIFICDMGSYETWFTVFNSPKAADKLVLESDIDGVAYSKFHQDIKDEETLIYLFDCDIGALLVTWSFPSNSTPHNVIDSYITRMLRSMRLDSASKSKLDEANGGYKNFQLGIVYDSGTALSGSGCYDDKGGFIVLINNTDAKNPTYAELLSFLRKDKTEAFPYHLTPSIAGFYYGSASSNVNLDRIKEIIDGNVQPSLPNICADFAERLHNNAEKAGIRAGYVNGTNHAFNVFETTDKGLVYIDDVGVTQGPSGDTLITIDSSGKVHMQWLFPEQSQGWSISSYLGGDVYYKNTVWDGKW